MLKSRSNKVVTKSKVKKSSKHSNRRFHTKQNTLKRHQPDRVPDALATGPGWERKALDNEQYPIVERDGGMAESDYELFIDDVFNNADFDTLRQETYVNTPLEAKFANFRKITELSGIPRNDMGNSHFHIGLQHLLKQLREEATEKYQFDLCLEAAHRCMDFDLYASTVDLLSKKGYTDIPQAQLAPLVQMASFRRSKQYLTDSLDILNQFGYKDMQDYSPEVIEFIAMYHEMVQEYDQADKVYSDGIKMGKLSVPWAHQRNSHINAKKFAQLVPTNNPKNGDAPTPEADVVQLNGSHGLLSRVKLRYACYSLNDHCENNGTVHPKINIPHNLVVQAVVRGKNAKDGIDPYHKLWSPMQNEMRDYLYKFGVATQHVSRAANLFWVDHMFFDRLPTPGNQNPAKRPAEPRRFRTEGYRAIAREIEAEEAEKQKQREERAASLDQKM